MSALNLPLEIWEQIFRNSDVASLAKLSLTCRKMHHLIKLVMMHPFTAHRILQLDGLRLENGKLFFSGTKYGIPGFDPGYDCGYMYRDVEGTVYCIPERLLMSPHIEWKNQSWDAMHEKLYVKNPFALLHMPYVVEPCCRFEAKAKRFYPNKVCRHRDHRDDRACTHICFHCKKRPAFGSCRNNFCGTCCRNWKGGRFCNVRKHTIGNR